MRFSMILEMVDRLSAPARRAKAGVSGLRESARAMGRQVRNAAGELRRGERSVAGFARTARRAGRVQLGRMFQSAGQRARALTRDLGSLVTRLKLVERAGFATGRGLRKLGGMAAGLMKTGLLAGGAAAAGAGGFALFDLFRTAGQFEQYQMMLDNIMGSEKAGGDALKWISDFAATTPFELDEVVQSFLKLKNAGIDPMAGSLLASGDAAAGMSESLLRAAEAMADAANGQFERLVDLGIQASTQGNRVRITWMKNEKQYEKIVDKTDKLAVSMAVAAAWNDKYAGSQAKQATSLFGIISNLKDMWSRFLVMIAEAGIFDFVKGKLQGLLDKVNQMAANGDLQKWADKISEKMIKAWEWGEKFVDTDWESVIQDIKDIAQAVGLVADAILELKRLKDDFSWISNLGPVNPLRGLRALNSLREGIQAGSDTAPAPARAPARLPSDNRFSRQLLGKQASFNIGGALKIDVKSSPDLAVRATPVATPGRSIPIEVRTGKTMRGSA